MVFESIVTKTLAMEFNVFSLTKLSPVSSPCQKDSR